MIKLCLPTRWRRRPIMVAVFGGLVVGAVLSWWLNKAPTPWLEFISLNATYTGGSNAIQLNGLYYVDRECFRQTLSRTGVIWRTEALATDGQIALYGPTEAPPVLTEGEHTYSGAIALLEPIIPDGWVVRVIVTCPGALPETVASPPARVIVIKYQ